MKETKRLEKNLDLSSLLDAEVSQRDFLERASCSSAAAERTHESGGCH